MAAGTVELGIIMLMSSIQYGGRNCGTRARMFVHATVTQEVSSWHLTQSPTVHLLAPRGDAVVT